MSCKKTDREYVKNITEQYCLFEGIHWETLLTISEELQLLIVKWITLFLGLYKFTQLPQKHGPSQLYALDVHVIQHFYIMLNKRNGLKKNQPVQLLYPPDLPRKEKYHTVFLKLLAFSSWQCIRNFSCILPQKHNK